MLLIKTKLSASSIHGAGLFAEEFIQKGSRIWEFREGWDKVFTQDELNSFDESTREFLNIYCYRYKGQYYLGTDNDRFFNHSGSPNCANAIDETVLGGGYTTALQDIYPGEELTCDYTSFGYDEEDHAFNLGWLAEIEQKV